MTTKRTMANGDTMTYSAASGALAGQLDTASGQRIAGFWRAEYGPNAGKLAVETLFAPAVYVDFSDDGTALESVIYAALNLPVPSVALGITTVGAPADAPALVSDAVSVLTMPRCTRCGRTFAETGRTLCFDCEDAGIAAEESPHFCPHGIHFSRGSDCPHGCTWDWLEDGSVCGHCGDYPPMPGSACGYCLMCETAFLGLDFDTFAAFASDVADVLRAYGFGAADVAARFAALADDAGSMRHLASAIALFIDAEYVAPNAN